MVVNTLMYVMLAIAGVVGSAIAWDDLFQRKNPKDDGESEQTAE